jgi:hypothetical protein
MDFLRSTTIYKSLVHNPDGPPLQSPRSQLQSSLSGMHQPFPQAVAMVNSNLGSHKDNSLSPMDATRYSTISHKIEHEGMSNSYGFGSSALHWAKKGNVTGAVMNFGGFLLAGGYDHAQMKLGRR